MSSSAAWDVLISYASPDREAVERLAHRLVDEEKLRVFFDDWRLIPGDQFGPALEKAIRGSRSCAVMLGKSGIRPWQNEEMQAALKKAVSHPQQPGDSQFRVFLVLLPGAENIGDDDIPAFLGLRTRVDFRTAAGLDAKLPFAQLVAGIRGVAPGRPDIPPRWLRTVKTADLHEPTGIAVHDDTIFVSDHETGEVLAIRDGQVVNRASGLDKPHHVIVTDDTVVVADTRHHELAFFDLQLNPLRRQARLAGHALRRPHGLATNFPGEFYLTDADNHRILLVTGDEVSAVSGKENCRKGSGPGEYSVPCGVATSPDCIFVADTYNHRIQVLTRELQFLSSFGKLGHGAGELSYPVAVAPWHHWVIVADEHNKRLQLWQRQSQGLPFETACVRSDLCGPWLGSPFGLCFDDQARLFVADRKKAQILSIDLETMVADLELSDHGTKHE